MEEMGKLRFTPDFPKARANYEEQLAAARDPCTPQEELVGVLGPTQHECRVSFDQCREGLDAKKATTLSSNIPDFKMKFVGRRCNHPRGHEPLQGRLPDGRLKTSIAQAYPELFCQHLAEEHIRAMKILDTRVIKDVEDLGEEMELRHSAFTTAAMDLAKKVRAPAVAPSWDPM